MVDLSHSVLLFSLYRGDASGVRTYIQTAIASLLSQELTYLDSDIQAFFRLLGLKQSMDLQATFNYHRDDVFQLPPLHLPQG